MSGFLRLHAQGVQSAALPYPTSGFDKYGMSCAPPQPRSTTRGWIQNYEKAFQASANRQLLKNHILQHINGKISDESLTPLMDEAAGWYKWKYLEPGYGPSTPQQVQHAVDMMNQKVVDRAAQLYAAQRKQTDQWLRQMHRPYGHGYVAPHFENDYDQSIELNYN